MNWYAYCNNNPLRFVDPTGLQNTSFYNDLAYGGDYSYDAYAEAMGFSELPENELVSIGANIEAVGNYADLAGKAVNVGSTAAETAIPFLEQARNAGYLLQEAGKAQALNFPSALAPSKWGEGLAENANLYGKGLVTSARATKALEAAKAVKAIGGVDIVLDIAQVGIAGLHGGVTGGIETGLTDAARQAFNTVFGETIGFVAAGAVTSVGFPEFVPTARLVGKFGGEYLSEQVVEPMAEAAASAWAERTIDNEQRYGVWGLLFTPNLLCH